MYLFLAAAEATEPSNPILPDIGEMFWGLVTFLTLYLLVKFVLLPPVLKIMNERESRIKADQDAAKTARQKRENLSDNFESQLSDVRAEASALIDQARSEAMAERALVISQAEREVEEMKKITESKISKERSKALKSIRPEVVKLSVNAACRVLDTNIDAESAKPVFEEKLKNLS